MQDAINAHQANGTRFSEAEILHLFRGTCEAVRAMHTFRGKVSHDANGASGPKPSRREMIPSSSRPRSKQQRGNLGGPVAHHGSDDEDDEDELLPQAEGDGEDGYSYGKSGESSIPLVSKHAVEDEGDVVFDGDEELANHGLEATSGDPSEMEVVPYAHRDLKPG